MNDQIKEDKKFLKNAAKNLRILIRGLRQSNFDDIERHSRDFMDSYLDAQARVTRYEERQRVVDLLKDYTPTIEDIGYVAGTQYQGLVVEWRVKNDELKEKILVDNN